MRAGCTCPFGKSTAAFDHVSVIQRDRTVTPGEAIAAPNAWDFVRFRDVEPGVNRRHAAK